MRRKHVLNEWTGKLMGLLSLLPLPLSGELVVGFEDVALTVPPALAYTGPGGGVYYNGSDGAGGFASGGVYFETAYNADWMSWSGWVYSTTTDVETAGFGNQYSSYAGGAASGNVYAVTYAPSSILLPVGAKAPISIAVSNTTYAGISMRDGDDFAKQFGVGDYLKLSITGRGKGGETLGTIEVYLADFREETDPNFILTEWQEVALTALDGGTGENVHTIGFSLESTDVGAFGMNTPSYLAVDDLVLGDSPTWGAHDLESDGWVNTGNFLGWVYPEGDFVWVEKLGRWAYLPESHVEAGAGAWAYVPR